MRYRKDETVKTRNTIVLAIAAVFVLLTASLLALYRSMSRPSIVVDAGLTAAAPETPQQHMAGAYSSRGVMSVQTYQRLAGIQTTIERTGKITNTDLQWTLALLHSKPIMNSADNENTLHRAVFLYLSGLKPLPKSEGKEIFAATVPYVSDKNPYVRGMAAAALGESSDPRALPFLQKMQSDPDPQVQQSATRSTKYLQKHPIQVIASPLR